MLPFEPGTLEAAPDWIKWAQPSAALDWYGGVTVGSGTRVVTASPGSQPGLPGSADIQVATPTDSAVEADYEVGRLGRGEGTSPDLDARPARTPRPRGSNADPEGGRGMQTSSVA